MAARTLHKLSVRKIETVRKPGRHSDGGHLFFVLTPAGRAKWTFVYRRRDTDGKCELGLGSFPAVSLAQAREKAAEARQLLAEGKDPLIAKQAPAPKPETPTFGAVLDELIKSKATVWRSQKHRQQWRNSVAQHCGNLIDMPIDQVTVDDVLAGIAPIWASKGETAARVRNRVENTINYAIVRGYRNGPNPAQWRGHLEHALP